jgi:glutamate transport system permease protein
VSVIFSHLSAFGDGLTATVELTVTTFLLAFGLGLLLAACRISPVTALRVAGGLYVAAFRSVPLLALLTLFVFGLPFVGLVYPLFWTAVTAMTLYWAAFFCEAVRSGIRTVPAGQIEAARSLGLTFSGIMRLVVLPQALRAMIQPMANLLIAVTLNSSLAAAVGVTRELTGQTELLDQQYGQAIITFGAAAVCYVALTLGIGWGASVLARKVALA